MTESITGGCHCGAVRFNASAPPRAVLHCHCHSCRKISGAPVSTWAIFRAADVDWTARPPTPYGSSPGVIRGHCATCGTALTYAAEDRPDDIDIMIGALDDAAARPPVAHVWCQDRLAWLNLDEHLPQHQRTSGG